MSKVATTAKNTASKASKARGPKAGSSQCNQSVTGVKAPKSAGPEIIKSAVQAKTGNGFVVTTSHGNSIVVARVDRHVDKLAHLGEPVAPLVAYLKTQPKPEARLANGVESRANPHSAKAIADQKKAPSAKAEKAAAPKAAKNKAPANGGDRHYTKGATEIKAKPDSWRHYMLTCIQKHSTTAKAKAAHEKSGKFASNKLDFNWAAAQGYINWAK